MIRLNVNGEAVELDGVDPDTPLLWVLRDRLGLTGTHYGCGMSLCGSCTVHVDGVAARACSMPISTLDGTNVTAKRESEAGIETYALSTPAVITCQKGLAEPRYAVSVVVEHGGGGSLAAAPIARDVLLYALEGGLPRLEAYPAGDRDRIEEMFRTMPLRTPPAPAGGSSRA